MSCATYSWAQRWRRAVAHLHAGCRARPQPRCGRHPSATWPAPHVWQGWHQAHGLHHWRPHRQANHYGLRGDGGVWGVAGFRGEGLFTGTLTPRKIYQWFHVALPNMTFYPSMLFSPCFISHLKCLIWCCYRSNYVERELFSYMFRLHLHVPPDCRMKYYADLG